MPNLIVRFRALVGAVLFVAGAETACTRSEEVDTAPWVATDEPPPTAAVSRRLTREELSGTFRSLLGVVPENLSRLPADSSETGAAEPPVSLFEVEVYREIADEAARLAAPTLLRQWACDDDRACVEREAAAWIETAQRRALTPDERASYLSYLTAHDEDGVRRLLDVVFQAPQFLYVVETRRGAWIGPWELAARIAYVLWSEPPDEALRAAARSGELIDPVVLESHVRRMLDDPRAARNVGTTLARWVAPDLAVAAKAYSVYPQLDEVLRASMTEQFEHFAALALAQSFTLRDLLTTRQAPVDKGLAKLLEARSEEAGWSVVTLAEPRFGLLTLPGVLSSRARADDSSPVQRGLLIRDAMLCQPMPDPPPGVAALPPPASTGTTFRERLQEHTTDPTCASCHRLMDPLGFPFEIYDGIGRLRKNSQEIATDGTLEGVTHPAEFADLQGLVEALLATPELTHCWASHWIARLLGQPATRNAALIEQVAASFAAEKPLRDIIVEIATAPELRGLTLSL